MSLIHCISRPTSVLSKSHRPLSSSARIHDVDHRASSKLFADAEREEVADQGTTSRPTALLRTAPEHANWTGDESIEDAVLRMLIDKYKPLRTGTVRTAEEKIRRSPPTVIAQSPPPLPPISETPTATQSQSPPSSSVYRADEPLLPSVEGHKPWLTTFKVPSHASASIRYGLFSISPSSSPSQADDLARRKERDAKKRSEIAGRLTRAKESTLDYRLGIKNAGSGRQTQQVRPNPVSIKGWAGLVEERIERAHREGHFRRIPGRGRPLERSSEEHNPFIAPEEFLLNRIVQRQGAAPPWVEVQGELESAVTSFRATLQQSWIRRAVRMLTLSHSQKPLYPTSLSLADVRALRDNEWETRERAYHDSALAEVNSLVRKYNALAPYAVRRVYYVREVELAKIYHESGEEILQEIEGRLRGSRARAEGDARPGEDDEEELHIGTPSPGEVRVLRLRDLFWQWIRRGT
ncbi:hypothetical protein EI94DRAFT_1569545 [Lactarius quietus]|nr:hypothetical protein EI94DRAFT_1569545 [Lactarius quietus]